MTFEELKQIDIEGAFTEWISVKNAKYLGYIPKRFEQYFDDVCECGSENIIKNSLTMLTCCNPRCEIKQAFALAEMLTRFGIKGLKEATCQKIIKEMKAEDRRQKDAGHPPLLVRDSYVAMLFVPWNRYPLSLSSSAKGADFYKACVTIRNKNFTFADLISNLAIPSIGSEARKLLDGINTPVQLISEIKRAGSVRCFCMSKGFYSPGVSFNLRQSLVDIVTIAGILQSSIRTQGVLKLNVCMTGAIFFKGARTTKEKYLEACNKLCIDSRGVSVFEIKMNSAIETTPFILFSKPSGDRKYVAGIKRGLVNDMFGTHPVLVHVDNFYKFLEEVMEKWEQEGTKITAERLQKILKDSVVNQIQLNENTTI